MEMEMAAGAGEPGSRGDEEAEQVQVCGSVGGRLDVLDSGRGSGGMQLHSSNLQANIS